MAPALNQPPGEINMGDNKIEEFSLVTPKQMAEWEKFRKSLPPKDRLTVFCILNCHRIARKGKKFYCPELGCPIPQRRKYAALIARKTRLENTLADYKRLKNAVKELEAQKDYLTSRENDLLDDTRQEIKAMLILKRKWIIDQLRSVKKNLSATVTRIERKIHHFENKAINIPNSLVRTILAKELREYEDALQIMHRRIDAARREEDLFKRQAASYREALKLLKPANQGRGRPAIP